MKRLILLLAFFVSQASWGIGFYDVTPEERQVCISVAAGQTISDHFCECVRYYNRAVRESASWEAKKYYSGESVNSCKYFIARNGDRPQLLSLAYLYKGMAQQLLNLRTEATADMLQALQLNPKLQDAYVKLADTLSALGNNAKALDMVTEGLRNIPDSKPLKRRYFKLGGKEPLPQPHRGGETEKAPEAKAPSGKEAEPVPAPMPEEGAAKRPETRETTAPVQAEAKPAPIGSPSNPWCRFCPPDPKPVQPAPPAVGTDK